MSRNQRFCRRLVSAVCVWAIVLLTACQAAPNETHLPPVDSTDAPFDKATVPTDVTLEQLTFEADRLHLSSLGDVLKIDSIQEGENTFSFDSMLYDLQGECFLTKLSFAEASWESGLTAKGLFAVDMNEKQLYRFDRDGDLRAKTPIDATGESLLFCALSEDERYLAYNDGDPQKLTFLDFETDTSFDIEIDVLPRKMRWFRDGQLRVATVDSRLATIDLEQKTFTYFIDEEKVQEISEANGLGETFNNFVFVTEGETVMYTPIWRADEAVVGIGHGGFATSVLDEDVYVLRMYDLQQAEAFLWESAEPIETAVCTDEGQWIAGIGTNVSRKHTVRLCKDTEVTPISIFEEDRIAEPEVPEEPVIRDDEDDSEPTPPETSQAVLVDVPVIPQYPDYPTGCESVSTVMALRYAGEDVSIDTFVDEYLPKSRDFYIDGGLTYGPSPYDYFIGHPTSESSFGCMATVIEAALCNYFGSAERISRSETLSLEELCAQYIDQGTPVIVWATIAMLEVEPLTSWYLEDGSLYTWPGNEHCMLLVGYDSDNYYFNDPYAGALVSYPKSLADDRFEALGRQSVVIADTSYE